MNKNTLIVIAVIVALAGGLWMYSKCSSGKSCSIKSEARKSCCSKKDAATTSGDVKACCAKKGDTASQIEE